MPNVETFGSKTRLIIGGAPKSGTTALYYYLRQHPEFCLPEKKELHFFSRSCLELNIGGPGDNYVLNQVPQSLEEYQSFFRHCKVGQLCVEISPSYLYHHDAAEKINDHLPRTKTVFILRNPVEKAFSQYLHLVGSGREQLSFGQALAAEQTRTKTGYSDMWRYRESGLYSEGIEHYFQVFGRDAVKVFYYEEFVNETQRVLRDICEFADVEKDFSFQAVNDVNRSGTPKSTLITNAFIKPNAWTSLLRNIIPGSLGRSVRKRIRDWNTGEKPEFPEQIKAELNEYFTEDVLKVEQLVGRPSGWW